MKTFLDADQRLDRIGKMAVGQAEAFVFVADISELNGEALVNCRTKALSQVQMQVSRYRKKDPKWMAHVTLKVDVSPKGELYLIVVVDRIS